MDAIDITGVSKRFGRHVALRDVSLRVAPGSIFGFLGPNGAGKTTTMRGCMGLLRFDGGSARLLGLDPWHDRVELHRWIGYLPSSMGVFGRMRGRDMLEYAASLGGGDRQARRQLRERVLDVVELAPSDLDRPVVDYSKGMRQKVAFVQALQHRPELVLMDEPSDGLDPLIQHAVYELLRELARDGMTVLFSSHTLSEVEALCERVAIIRRGELVTEASLDELREQRPRIVRIASDDAPALARLDPHRFEPAGDDHLGRATYRTREAPDAIVAALVSIPMSDLVVEEPSLEEIFRSYYADGEAAQ